MARATKRTTGSALDRRLAAIRAIAPPIDATAIAQLRDALGANHGAVVAAAVRVIGAHEVEALVDAFGPAFTHLLDQPVECDPGCRGKTAVARALLELGRWNDAVFARGVRVIQHEPGWGDTAAELRGVCGIAHAQLAADNALDVLADLLADPERIARVAAAQGLGDAGRTDATALLRYKVAVGDEEPQVISTCMASLLHLAPTASLAFLIRILDDSGETSELAALALADSHREEACAPLIAWCDRVSPALRGRVGYLALALLRREPATAHLLDAIRAAERLDAVAAAKALATFRDDPSVARRLREAAAAHPDARARAEIEAVLG